MKNLLSFAQISTGKFRKEISTIDIRTSVKEVMSIQKHKAKLMGIEVSCHFFGFEGLNNSICTDEQCLQQVLLIF